MSNARVQIFGGGPVLPIEGFATGVTPQSNDYTMLMDATVASRVVTLPPAASFPGRIYIVKRTDSSGNTVTVVPTAPDSVDGGGSIVLAALSSAVFQSDGEGLWSVLATNGSGGGPVTDIYSPDRIVSQVAGDGTDTTLAAAITALAATGGMIYMKEGTYTIAAGITLPSPSKGIVIIGSGAAVNGGTTINYTEANGSLFIAGGILANLTLRDIRIVGDSSNQILFQSPNGAGTYDEVKVQDCAITGISQIVRMEAAGIINEAVFEDTDITLPTTGQQSFWRNQNAATVGKLVWTYVTASMPASSTFAVFGTGAGPDWISLDSYIGGPGASTIMASQIIWEGFRLDGANVFVTGESSRINLCRLSTVLLRITGTYSIVSDTTFLVSGPGGNSLELGGAEFHTVTGCNFIGGVVNAISIEALATDVTVTGCVFQGFITGIRAASSNLSASGNTGLVVLEAGAANNNRYGDNTGFGTSTIIGADSTVEGLRRKDVTAGATTGAFVTVFTHTNQKGLLGIGTIVNTGGVNAMDVRETVTDAFGVTDATITTVNPGNSYMLDLQTNFATARPPYVSYAVAVQQIVAATTYNLHHGSQGAL